jgi:hypothetical protein
MKISLVCEGDDSFVYVVDQDGNKLARVDYDDSLEDAIEKVAKGICDAFQIEFQGLFT